MKKLESFFREAAELTDAALERIVPSENTPPKILHQAMRWSLFGGGKRFRPALLLLVGRSFGAPDGRLIRTAAAVEMLHTYSLIHDDLPSMDDDDLRRGRAACHKKYGESTAILAGDALQAMAFQTIAEDMEISSETRTELLAGLGNAAARMVAGQFLDLEAEGRKIAADALRHLHELKTGALIAFSAKAGALLANADPAKIKSAADYGVKIGLLFQITDDLLDITQSSEVLGKTSGKDIAAEKATFPSTLGVDGAFAFAREIKSDAEKIAVLLFGAESLPAAIPEFLINRKK